MPTSPKLTALWILACSVLPLATASPRQYTSTELSFISRREYAHPFDFTQVEFNVTFRQKDGRAWVVPGFWDGGHTWRVRFAPSSEGTWSYVTHCSAPDDPGLEGIRGALEVAPASGPHGTDLHGGILHASPDGRFLAYQDNTPFFYLADTWWSAPSYKMPISIADNPEIDSAVTGDHPFQWAVKRRSQQGFTAIQWHGSQGMFSTDPNRDSMGYIFTRMDSSDPTTLRYWRKMDEYYQCLAAAGLVVNWGVAQHATLDSQSLDDLKRLFRYMIARFGSYPSIFFITQEYNAPNGDVAGRRRKVFALCDYVKRLDPYHRALTLHVYPVKTADPSWSQPWCDWIMDQTGHFHAPHSSDYRWIYAQTAPKPMLEAELNYEGFTNPEGILDGKPVTERTDDARVIRASAYTAIQCGCFGYGYGASGSYGGAVRAQGQLLKWGSPVPSWWDSIANTGNRFPGGTQLRWLRQCYESVAWWKLVPEPDAVPAQRQLLVKADGSETFLVWYPSGVSLSGAETLTTPYARSYRAVWFNPRNGASSPAGTLRAAGPGVRLPPRPDVQDWMLVLLRSALAALPGTSKSM